MACGRGADGTRTTQVASPLVVEASIADGCSARLVARASHPFLAEFSRRITITCGASHRSLTLLPDPGRMGRVELVRRGAGRLAITDAFQSATLRTSDLAVVESRPENGKWEDYSTPCVHEQLFARTAGTFLGAFDYCEHRWQFLPP